MKTQPENEKRYFTCDSCGRTLVAENSFEDAVAAAAVRYGANWVTEIEPAVVCDACYEKITGVTDAR